MAQRVFIENGLNHSYQRTKDHGVLFYSIRDHLVFFTIFCVMARRHQVRVLKLVQMPDHTHHSTITSSRQQLSGFSRDYTAVFAKEYNRSFGLKGPVFETPFSSSVKRGDKAIRSNLIYLDNNPVERKLVKNAEDYRWNYLAYAQSAHPFSEKIALRFASMPLRRAINNIKRMCSEGRYLGYQFLSKTYETILSAEERNQLTDYIISTYSVIDHAGAIRYFGTYEQELIAAHATKGSEYDIDESFIGKSDVWYARFSSILQKQGKCAEAHEFLSWSQEEKQQLFELLKHETDAPRKQIAAYLHLPVGT